MNKINFVKMATRLVLALSISTTAFADKLHLLESDVDAMAARRDIILKAEKEILLEYFAVGRDAMTAAGMSLLIRKAREGVKVKIIMDNYAKQLSTNLLQEILQESVNYTSATDRTKIEQNLEIKLYNKLAQLQSIKDIYHRDHAKMIVIDGNVAVMGGRNATSEYFGLNPGRNYVDLDTLLFGKTVADLRANFMKLWESDLVSPVEEDMKSSIASIRFDKVLQFCVPRSDSPNIDQEQNACLNRMIRQVRDGKEEFYELAKGDFSLDQIPPRDWEAESVEASDLKFSAQSADHFNSDDKRHGPALLTEDYLAELSKANYEVRLLTPYLLATPEFFRTIKILRNRNVVVRVITNSVLSTDNTIFYATYSQHLQELINLGVEVHEFKSDRNTLHAKLAVIDGETAIIGSYNLDPISAYKNREVALIVHDKEHKGFATGVESFMDRIQSDSFETWSARQSRDRAGFIQSLLINGAILLDPILKKIM